MLKYIIIGKQASGKSFFLNLFKEKGLKTLKTHTTRPKRSENEDTYFFHEESELPPKDILASDRVNGHLYFTTKSDILLSDVMVLTPAGAIDVAEAFPEIGFRIIYLTADKEKRDEKLNERATLNSNLQKVQLEREKWDEYNFKLWNEIIKREKIEEEDGLPSNILAISHIINDYNKEQLNRYIDECMQTKQLMENLEQIIEKALTFEILEEGPNHTIHTFFIGGDMKDYTLPEFAHAVLNDPNGFLTFMVTCITRGVFTQDKPPVKEIPNQMSIFDMHENIKEKLKND